MAFRGFVVGVLCCIAASFTSSAAPPRPGGEGKVDVTDDGRIACDACMAIIAEFSSHFERTVKRHAEAQIGDPARMGKNGPELRYSDELDRDLSTICESKAITALRPDIVRSCARMFGPRAENRKTKRSIIQKFLYNPGAILAGAWINICEEELGACEPGAAAGTRSVPFAVFAEEDAAADAGAKRRLAKRAARCHVCQEVVSDVYAGVRARDGRFRGEAAKDREEVAAQLEVVCRQRALKHVRSLRGDEDCEDIVDALADEHEVALRRMLVRRGEAVPSVATAVREVCTRWLSSACAADGIKIEDHGARPDRHEL